MAIQSPYNKNDPRKDHLGVQLCKILGIDHKTHTVASVTLKVEAGEPPRVVVDFYAQEDEWEQITATLVEAKAVVA